MNFKFVKILFILEILSTLQGLTSNEELNKSSLECDIFNEHFIPFNWRNDCVIFCDESDIHQGCSVNIIIINNAKMIIEIPKNLQIYIKNLTLEGEFVSFLPQQIHKVLPNLLEFSASSTSIKIASRENFQNLKNLTTLKLSNGELTDICGTAFHDLQSLIEIDLSVNEIKFLHPNLFSKTTQLRKINLSSNLLEILHPMLFSLLPQLSILDVSFNAITFIDRRQFVENRQLSELLLIGNDIKVIEYGAFDGLESLKVLTIKDNPCTTDYVYDYDDIDMNTTIKFINENCNKISENQRKIEEKINSYNKWFGSKYVADKCGSEDKMDYSPIILESSGVELHKMGQIWIYTSLFVTLVVNFNFKNFEVKKFF